jgi:hypothetical protein
MFYLQTRGSWQKEPAVTQLTDIKQAMSAYPLIERKFFDDLIDRCHTQKHYYVEAGLLKILNAQQKELDPNIWILIWAVDFRDRVFQILFERNPEYGGKGAIAAVGPQDLLEFISSMKHNAILPTLTLLNSPEKMKQVAILVSRPPSYKEKAEAAQRSQELNRFKHWVDNLKQAPNVKGQWFPQNKILNECPECSASMAGIAGENSVYGILICPNCGHTLAKPLSEIGQPPSGNPQDKRKK